VEAVSGGWFETDTPSGRTRLVPTVSFQLKNVSDATVPSVQVNVLFRRITESHEWSDVFRRAITSRGLMSGSTTEPITVLSSAGYTGDEPTAHLLRHSQFVDTAVSIYARHGSGDWTCLGEYPIPREIVGRHFGPADLEHVTTRFRLR
jgi:hypothetical protein